MTSRFLLLFVLFLLLPRLLPVAAADLSGRVTWIYDGDTIKVENIGKVRLVGIDAPEHKDSGRDSYYLRQGIRRARLRQVSKEALTFLIETVKGKYVTLETDNETRDRHGRRLAYVYLPDGTLLNQQLIAEGYAAVYRKFDFRMKQQFIATERTAQKNGLGLWQP